MVWDRSLSFLERPDVGRRYQLWVSTPTGYEQAAGQAQAASANQPNQPAAKYPLILCLDAPWTFGTATDVTRLLGLGKQIPHAIVAGIAHDVDGRDAVEQRAMDFTVTPAEVPPVMGVRSAAELLGGAEQFRIWLRDQVLPQLKDQYAIGSIVLLGHSFSAAFGVHCLLTDAQMFDGYLLASPSVWWDNKVLFEREAKFAATGAGLPAKVYISMGSEESDEFSHQLEFYRQVDGRNYDGLTLGWDCFDDENHMSVVNAAISRGLRFLLTPDETPGTKTSAATDTATSGMTSGAANGTPKSATGS